MKSIQGTRAVLDSSQSNKSRPRKAFLNFLEEMRPKISRLVIGGDLFDFWIGHRTVVYYPYLPVLKRLMDFRAHGIEMDYVEGNHDFHMGPFFKETLQCRVYPKEAYLKLEGFHICVCHGDLMNPGDRGHRLLKKVFGSSCFKGLAGIVHPDWQWRIGHWASRLSHRHRREPPNIGEVYKRLAEEKLKKSSIDVLIAGHNHCPDAQTFEFSGSRKYYYNTGDWLTHFSYLELESGRFSLKYFSL